MSKLTLMWICRGGSVSTEVENLDDLDWIVNEMEKRGFIMWPGLLPPTNPKDDDHETRTSQNKLDLEDSVKFCPLHGERKKWEDTRDGGYYCGEKVDGKWCGYKENEDGQMTKPPRTKPDYIKF